ncbi:hypothetical protein MKK75_14785 [Methylobacterium sp. J-030]|uniref:hypothetical protein n=1 Tax=Methylobacterium sp. J-030 TaxID=2836627 RepID=UPI001FB9D795|nr:hypothetical protein [Methylobacterium sp. J-030]MCJ2070045.1 hypothetical protein [Methylobacterium sp. J-030]
MTAGLETFAKVRALHDSTTNLGEKASAAARMKALAAKAGMTVDQAVSKLDTLSVTIAASRTVNMADFFDTPYFREQMARREQERAERWHEVLEEYGTEEAVFEPGPMERALDKAAAQYAAQHGPDPGWDAFPLGKVPAAIVATVEAAWPMPATVRAAWEEFAFWDKLSHDREARGTACGDHSPPVQIRCRILEQMLDAAPALSLSDLRARVSWLAYRDEIDSHGENRTRLVTLRADIERMGRRIREQDAETVQSGHSRRTTADKRRDVLSLFGQGLTDREIARRAGVSPTTIGTIRRQQT